MVRRIPTSPDTPDWTLPPQQETAVDLLASGKTINESSESSLRRARIVAEARRWIGTPWHHRACLRGVGVDCLEMVRATLLAVGVPWPPLADPYATMFLGRSWFRHVSREFMLEIFQSVPALSPLPLEVIQPGDICLLGSAGRPCAHVVLVSRAPPDLHIIHMGRSWYAGVVLEQPVPPELWRFFRHAFFVHDVVLVGQGEGA